MANPSSWRQRRQFASVCVVLLLLLSGCSGLFGGSQATPSEIAGTSSTSGTTKQGASGADLQQLSASIILTLPEVGTEYNRTGERVVVQSTAPEDLQSQLEDDGVQAVHERSFERDENSNEIPAVLFAAVTIYESEETAASGLAERIGSVSSGPASEENVTVLGNAHATRVQFESSNGAQNTLLAGRVSNIEIYVVTSDPEREFSEFTKSLYSEMLQDALQSN